MTSAPDERQEALAAMGAQTSGPWGQQSSLNTDRVQRMGVRHLRPDDPLRRAVLNKGKVLSKTCSECKLEKKADHYSKTQLKKSDHARCNEGVAGLPPTPDPVMEAENKNKTPKLNDACTRTLAARFLVRQYTDPATAPTHRSCNVSPVL